MKSTNPIMPTSKTKNSNAKHQEKPIDTAMIWLLGYAVFGFALYLESIPLLYVTLLLVAINTFWIWHKLVKGTFDKTLPWYKLNLPTQLLVTELLGVLCIVKLFF